MLLDTHCHTVASGHAYSTVTEYVKAAAVKGFSLIAITDHAPKMPGTCGIFHFLNLNTIPRTVNGVEVLSGVELNIMDIDGTVDLPPSVLTNLDVVIASLHVPCFAPLSLEENTEAIINTIKNPFVKVIGHLGDPRYPFDLEAVLDAAIENQVILEINNASLDSKSVRKGDKETMKSIVLACKKRNWPVILGSDAHFVSDLGNFTYVEQLVSTLEMPENLILNTDVDLFKQYVL